MKQANLARNGKHGNPLLIVASFGCALILTLLACIWFVNHARDPSSFPIRKVMIEGDFRNLKTNHLESLVAGTVKGGFFAVDVAAIREVLIEDPWIFDVTVRRVWPETLRVSVIEQEPVALWGGYALLNEQAELFVPSRDTFPSAIPQLDGPIGQEELVLRRFNQLREQLAQLDLELDGVALSERQAWTLALASGQAVLLGRNDFDSRLQRFLTGYNLGLARLWGRVALLDLRYTNGFALRLHDPVGTRDAKMTNGSIL